ncbi:MAG: DUF4215 domain-containing protein [Patescibacteria group bacterium]|jgi:cysteine-rich repeat protein
MSKDSKRFLFFGFILTCLGGLIFLYLALPSVQQALAATININATVPAAGTICGNGIKETGETCDGTDGASSCYNGQCNSNCTCPVCGNSTIDTGEVCDDGNGVSCDGCNNTCSRADSVCGDNIAECGEACDGSDAASGGCYNNYCNSNCTCPVCGNGTIDAGEGCESDGDCSSGYFCNSTCVCEIAGTPVCVPTATVCSYGSCINGVQSGVCTNGCSNWPSTQSCYIAVCGNGTRDSGEECDDGNTVSGDGCSGACQLEVGCGNGIIDSGEACDDGNTVSGDCCSSVCQIELLISNVSIAAAQTSGNVSWSTLCQPTADILEWGSTPAVGDGSVSGLSGTNFSHNITGLQSNTVYYYRITASAGSLQTVHTGSFVTTGGVENCTNGLDDNHNGFCDYPASTCTDGSTPGDPACSCTPNFSCTPGVCQPNDTLTVSCVDKTVPPCRPNYEYTESCQVCPGVSCGTCQQLNPVTCECVATNNCCGNTVCEAPGEDPYNCSVDCHVACLSQWECTPWSPAVCPPAGGVQTRQCFDSNGCQVPINPPASQQVCNGGPNGNCQGLSCGQCQQINAEQCVCEQMIPCCGDGICATGESNNSCPQDCVTPCTPSWTCLGWGACENGLQKRECYDVNKCDLNIGRPAEVISCQPGCEVACGICQQISLSSCSCLATAPCCGNRLCETGENTWSCPADCGVPPEFKINLPQCLDGIDNDRDGLIDYPADSGCSKPLDNSEISAAEIAANIQKFIQKEIIDQVVEKVIDNPQVEQANVSVAAPVLVATVVVNTFASFSFINFFSYLQYFITQPFAVLFRRRRKKWGVIYNALTKQPVDLAIVRLYQKENNRLIQSRVTDKLGRYSFLIDPGRYYLTVTKPKFDFPTAYLQNLKEDVSYLDLYHGGTIEVTGQRADITANIPIDPQIEEKPAAKIILQYYLRKLQYLAAFAAIPLATISLIISPGLFTLVMLCFHCLLYALFRRLGYQKPPRNWGMVYDHTNRKPVSRAILRIYDKQYNKLLDTRVTDGKGRYSFLVNNNIYYVTAEKLGYHPFKSNEIDLLSKDKEAVVSLDIGLQKAKAGSPPAAPVQTPPSAPILTPPITPVAPPTPPVQTPLPSLSGVGRDSLEELMKAKQQAEQLKHDIEEKKEDLEQLEEKVKNIETNIDSATAQVPPVETKLEPSVPPVEIEKMEKPAEPKADEPNKEKSIFG